MAGTGNRNDVLPLPEYPSERELGRRYSLIAGDQSDCVCDGKVPLELLSQETGIGSAPIIWSEFLDASKTRTEEAAPKGTVGDQRGRECDLSYRGM